MKEIIENFDRAAEYYESRAQPQAALAKLLADWILPEERKGSVLELGAGTGLFTRLMRPWQGSYTATDAAPRMVALGQKNCPTAHWKILDARQPVDTSPVNWIFACSVLQWLPEPQEVLRNWRNILSNDGNLVLAVLLPGTLGELQTLLPEAKPLKWHTATEWRNMVERAGFVIEHEQIWEQQSIHVHSLDLVRAVHAMGLAPYISVGPGRLRTALHKYDQKYATPGGVRATWRAWLARAKVVARP